MKTLCLFNPKAGRCSETRLKRAFSGRDFWGEVTFLSLAGSGNWHEELNGRDRVAVFGGDGTVHHVIQRLASQPQELCVFPAGTANDLGCVLGLPPELEKILDLFERGKAVAYDTIAVNGRHVITGGGFGLGYSAASTANKLRSGPLGGLFRKFFRAKIYLLTLAWHGLVSPPPRMRFRLQCDGRASEGRTQSILFCNQALMGKRVLVAPGTSAVDGKFHLVRFTHESAVGILRTLGHLKSGSPRSERQLERDEVESACIEFEHPTPAYGDGEEFPPQIRWDLHCHRGAIRLRVPMGFHGAPCA